MILTTISHLVGRSSSGFPEGFLLELAGQKLDRFLGSDMQEIT